MIKKTNDIPSIDVDVHVLMAGNILNQRLYD